LIAGKRHLLARGYRRQLRSIERDAMRLRAAVERSGDPRSIRASAPAPPLMAERANIRLQLANRPENVMLVREALTGVADALAVDRGDLIDIHTAVTEACNNVVQHAYAGEEGPLDVVVEPAPDAVTVVVRDWGVGIPTPHGGTGTAAHEAGPGIGLTAIHTLTQRLDLRRPAGGGTEVRMEFATLGARPPRPHAMPAAALPAIAPAAHAPTIALTVTPGALARTVLPRLMCGLAVRAHFSTDRLSDLYLIADALGASAGVAPLHTVADVQPRALELRIGPLERGRGERLVADSSLHGLGGSVIAKLVDRCQVERAGSYEVLALRLMDERGATGRDRAKFVP
jgi:serine/threonine-protein kinase RsbW